MGARRRLAGRLTYLWTFELIGAALFVVQAWAFGPRFGLGWRTAVGLGLAVLLLAQGSLYWYAKLRAVRRRPLLSGRRFARLYGGFRRANRALLPAGGAVLLAAGLAGPAAADLWFGLGFWTLAVLEYVNYYHRQLMYDTPAEVRWLVRAGRLKPAPLARDLAAGRL